jgi:phosphoglycerate dehydrogenase-like enzyme
MESRFRRETKSTTAQRRIALQVPLSPAQLQRLRGLSPKIEIDENTKDLSKADIVYTGSAGFDPSEAPDVRWVQLNLVGIESLIGGPLAKSGVPVANVRGAYATSVAEFAIALLLALGRQLPLCLRLQSTSKWDDSMCGASFYGKTVAIVGYGSIGRQIARIAHAMGVQILACKRDPEIRRETSSFVFPGTGDPEGILPVKWFGTNQIRNMFQETDHVVVTLPLTSQTRSLIGADEISVLPSHALIVNVGRGSIVDEEAIANALNARRIAGAALDVFSQEPLAPDSPLWRAPNALITPHIGSYTTEQAACAGEVLIENVRRDLADEPLLNLVNFSAGY